MVITGRNAAECEATCGVNLHTGDVCVGFLGKQGKAGIPLQQRTWMPRPGLDHDPPVDMSNLESPTLTYEDRRRARVDLSVQAWLGRPPGPGA